MSEAPGSGGLLAATKNSAATLLAAGFVFGLEVLQALLPGRSGDITDPLLTLAIGALLALFDPAMGATSGRAGSGSAWSATRGRRSR